ncbi:MAG TPA: UbiD family decarboxylase [Candidatus Acidoferrales bacterium]|nr:UbiD family decarboxylase [Candidatus Acidoferrales bacterium]
MQTPDHAQAALDLRVFVDRVGQAGELKQIRGAHWDLEIGALTEIAAGTESPPALLFDEIPGYPPGFRVLTNICQSQSRHPLALGISPPIYGVELVKEVKRRLANLRPIPPREVSRGPVLENIARGSDVNVLKFPAPRWHAEDGGRYIGTFDAVVCKDPESGFVNVGTYRVQVHDEKTVGLFIIPGKHGGLIAEKYWSQGKPCPLLIACGIAPSIIAASAVGIPWGLGEYEFLGGLLGAPVPVVKSEIFGLPMPASAEIVLEGLAPPPAQASRLEGPFGEWPGYYASGALPAPVVNIEAIYHRNAPIITGDPPLKTYLNGELYMYIRAANVWSSMERAGIPDVQGIWFPRQGRFIVAVAVRQRYSGHAKQAAHAVLSTRDGGRDIRMVIVVDDDIDITNVNELLWAVASRWEPRTQSEIVDVPASVLNPTLPPERKAKNDLVSSCIIIDACRPYHWIKAFPAISAAAPEYKAQMLKRWRHLFAKS